MTIDLLLANEIKDSLKMLFFAACVYLLGNLPVRLATQRKFSLWLLATTCNSVCSDDIFSYRSCSPVARAFWVLVWLSANSKWQPLSSCNRSILWLSYILQSLKRELIFWFVLQLHSSSLSCMTRNITWIQVEGDVWFSPGYLKLP